MMPSNPDRTRVHVASALADHAPRMGPPGRRDADPVAVPALVVARRHRGGLPMPRARPARRGADRRPGAREGSSPRRRATSPRRLGGALPRPPRCRRRAWPGAGGGVGPARLARNGRPAHRPRRRGHRVRWRRVAMPGSFPHRPRRQRALDAAAPGRSGAGVVHPAAPDEPRGAPDAQGRGKLRRCTCRRHRGGAAPAAPSPCPALGGHVGIPQRLPEIRRRVPGRGGCRGGGVQRSPGR